MAKITVGTRFAPQATGHGAIQPPRKSSVAMALTVIILAYSAMKKLANFMLLYSVWKPATSSFSASGRSNGTRLVSAKAAIMKMIKLTICGNGPCRIFQWKMPPAWLSTSWRKLSVLEMSSGGQNIPVEDAARLALHQLAQAERIGDEQRRGDGQRHGQFVADHLRRTAQAADQGILVIRRPPGEHDAVDAHRRHGQDEEHADIEIGGLRSEERRVGKECRSRWS